MLSACIVFILQALSQSREILDVRAENAKQQEQLFNNFEQLPDKKSEVIRRVRERVEKSRQEDHHEQPDQLFL